MADEVGTGDGDAGGGGQGFEGDDVGGLGGLEERVEIGEGWRGVLEERGERSDLAWELEGKAVAEGEVRERGRERSERRVGEEQSRVWCWHLFQIRSVVGDA